MPRLALLNVGRLLHPQSDPRVAPFIDNLARINALAERSKGFVWRYKDETGDDRGEGADGGRLAARAGV